ncbi:MAG: hypothetical protein PHU28_08565, partial [Methanosarcinaceae archaeon]|nr:hypothetical protein [Methanosarcinaceae archaeon]
MVIIKERNKERDAFAYGKLLALLYGSVGFVFGLFISVAAFMGYSIPESFGLFSLIFGKLALLSLPLFYGVSGFFAGYIPGILYNSALSSKTS